MFGVDLIGGLVALDPGRSDGGGDHDAINLRNVT